MLTTPASTTARLPLQAHQLQAARGSFHRLKQHQRQAVSGGLFKHENSRKLTENLSRSFSVFQLLLRTTHKLTTASLGQANCSVRLRTARPECKRRELQSAAKWHAVMGPYFTGVLRRSFQLTVLCGVLLTSVKAHVTVADASKNETASDGGKRLGDRELQTACARDLILVLSGGVEAEAVGHPRAAAIGACVRPLIRETSGQVFEETFVSDTLTAQTSVSEELIGLERQRSLITLGERSIKTSAQKTFNERTVERTGLAEVKFVRMEHFDGFSFRKLVTDVSDAQSKTRGRRRPNLRGRRLRRENPVGLAERFGPLVARPPPEVMALVRAVDAERGNGSALQRALGLSHFKFPDCEGSTEARCQLARAPTGQRFSRQVLNRFFALLFEAVAAAAPAAGMPISLSRFDLFHGHFFYARESRRFGILFHAREYPAEDPDAFPVNLGYCQRGSKVRYDATMNLRNILWLAPREAAAAAAEARARAPGVLCALDTRPDGILGKELVAEGLQLVHTVYEGDLGRLLGDVNYLGALRGRRLEQRLFIC